MKSMSLPSPVYWLLGACLIAFVALCCGFRDHRVISDSWEHVRAIKALVDEGLDYTGNPTYASNVPSLRYSPYTLALAAICRVTGLASYDALTLGGVVATVLLVAGIPYLLAAYGEARASTAALLMVVGLYGSPPVFSSSLALCDLPHLQVNPSNFSTCLSLFAWGIFARTLRPGRWWISDLLVALLVTAALLIHPWTGILTCMFLGIMAVASEARMVLVRRLLTIGVISGVLLSLWPWYNFFAAGRATLPNGLVFTYSNRSFLTSICVPGLILGVAALCERGRPAVRHFLLAGYAAYACGVLAAVVPESFPMAGAFGRLPLSGLLFLQLALGIFAYHAGLLRPATWGDRLAELFTGERLRTAGAALEVIVAASLVYFSIPLVWQSLRDPINLRPYIASRMGREEKSRSLRPIYKELLRGVGRGDVVLSDQWTMWPVPAFAGRIVYACSHTEVLVGAKEDQQRHDDTDRFFNTETSESERAAILDRYGVRWLILNQDRLATEVYAKLLEPKAVVATVDRMQLLDARRWKTLRSGDRSPDQDTQSAAEPATEARPTSTPTGGSSRRASANSPNRGL
jgi:hypothetical protein